MKDIWKKLSTKEKIKFVTSIIVGILVVIFATLNWKDQEIHFIFQVFHVFSTTSKQSGEGVLQ